MQNELSGDLALRIHFETASVEVIKGFDKGIKKENGRTHFDMQQSVGDTTYFLQGTFYDAEKPAAVRRWLSRFGRSETSSWIREYDSIFTLVIFDRAEKRVTCVSDLVGVNRMFVHESEGVVVITSQLQDQVALQYNPTLDPFGIYTYLTLLFPLDPHTLIGETKVTRPGGSIAVTDEGLQQNHFYERVETEVENYSSAEESVQAIDTVLRQYFERRVSGSRIPLVMLSGGIDSLVMLRYLAEVAPARVEALTFAVEGQENAELEEARIAARYYGVPHHELVISREDIPDLVKQGLFETDHAGPTSVAIRNWLEADGRSFDVFRGEDARLHTPPVDWAAKVGLVAHANGLHKSSMVRVLWKSIDLLEYWPFRTGKHYLADQAEKMKLRSNLQQYLLETFVRYSPPNVDGPLQERLYEETEHITEGEDIEQVFRKLVALTCRVQHSENRHWARYASQTSNAQLCLPFFHPQLMEVFNRIPFSVAARPLFKSPRKTRSWNPIVYKYVLRELLEGHAPEELLYRHKAAPSPEIVVFDSIWENLYKPVIRDSGKELLDALHGHPELYQLISSQRECLLRQDNDSGDKMIARSAHYLAYLCNMYRRCRQSDVISPGSEQARESK
ncbi:asparagine synthase-related protein [Salinibacter sp.]|uniref:asparagine synthase-related protein n=1 Tax=Salinibacter sp. TaxID=2065818 RepID=UPI0021E95A80|nr:asparagine synthetase B family protein [Salinibacter sp.]